MYPISLPKLGHAIIVNKEMRGSMEDVKALKAAFKTVGLDVEIQTNLSKSVSHFSCFFRPSK